nr:hypothetical protein [Tanacetum cinerariifolium]
VAPNNFLAPAIRRELVEPPADGANPKRWARPSAAAAAAEMASGVSSPCLAHPTRCRATSPGCGPQTAAGHSPPRCWSARCPEAKIAWGRRIAGAARYS